MSKMDRDQLEKIARDLARGDTPLQREIEATAAMSPATWPRRQPARTASGLGREVLRESVRIRLGQRSR